MTTVNGYTGCRSRRPTVWPTNQPVSVQLQEMQYENRSFSLDALECPRCGGQMRILAAINPPLEAIHKILDCLGLPSRPPPTTRPEREIDELDFS